MATTIHKTLYKQDSNKNIRVWWQESDGAKFRTCSGVLNGEIVHSEWSVCTPKNVGRSNETSGEAQCLLEVAANYTKKLSQGNYKDVLDTNISEDNYFKPMLAKEYGEDRAPTAKDYSNTSVFSQPKLDGIRCIATIEGLFSRQGKPILSAPHVHAALAPIFKEDPDVILDGELYTHKLADNFNELISLVRKTKPTKEDFALSEQSIQYFVYDFPSAEGVFSARLKTLSELIQKHFSSKEVVKMVETHLVINQEHLDELYGKYMQDGYEGQMVRFSDKPYENKRAKQLCKRKEFKDAEYVILDIEEGIGNRSGMAGNCLFKNSDGKEFRANIQGSRELYTKLLKSKDDYIGTLATVKYQNLTPDGIPRFPVVTKLLGTVTRVV